MSPFLSDKYLDLLIYILKKGAQMVFPFFQSKIINFLDKRQVWSFP